jgi:protein gp37
MAANSSIEWTESTWNPVTGCTKITSGCSNCYAERMTKRLKAMNLKNYLNGFNVSLHEHALDLPLHWKKPQTIFVNSMSDLFHEDVPSEFIFKVFETMRKANWHTFQILTKRSKRLAEMASSLPWYSNVWMGVTVEDDENLRRIDDLRNVHSSIRFVSFEPLLGPLSNINLSGIDWIIVGGESGPGARPMDPEWVNKILYYSREDNIPFFFKQWGRLLNGNLYNEMPNEKRKDFICEYQ